MFIDETEIIVSSGRGGDGVCSFRREKYIPRGGPDGGNGGKGGDVILVASLGQHTLGRVQHLRTYRGESGRPGGASNKYGRQGEPMVISVPLGTLVKDSERGHILKDLAKEGDQVIVAPGGQGGKGNKHFASSTNRAPRRATTGQPGTLRRLTLELRLVADVGLVGLPNAGKSTFLRRVTSARPKVADYPFTTLQPVLGIVDGNDVGMVLADIPGLIEGASSGAGLGDRFLRHIQRTRLLLHLVDGCEGAEAAVAAWSTIREELRLSGHGLEERPYVLAVSRVDAVDNTEEVVKALAEASGKPVIPLSSQSGEGVGRILGLLATELDLLNESVGKD
ncbi:MAG: GTP-binding protein [Pseudohongiellaceae bacterium]|jgi:GTP-binding protein